MVQVQETVTVKTILLNSLRLMIVLTAFGVAWYTAHQDPRLFGIMLFGLVFKDFFSSRVYDPIFREQSVQGWIFGYIKKLAPRRKPTGKFEI